MKKSERVPINSKGYGRISKIETCDKRLTLAQKGFYSYLCSFAGKDGRCYPSTERILSDCGICKDTFYSYRAILVELGYIEWWQENDECGRFSRIVYRICDYVEDEAETVGALCELTDSESNEGAKGEASEVEQKKAVNGKKPMTEKILSTVDGKFPLPLMYTSNNNNNTPSKRERVEREKPPDKLSFGKFGGVKLTSEEYEQLKSMFPNDYLSKIQRLDNYLLQNSNKGYDSHFGTIVVWADEDKDKNKPPGIKEQTAKDAGFDFDLEEIYER